MNPKYKEILEEMYKTIPVEIIGRKRINCKSNIRRYLKIKFNLKPHDGFMVNPPLPLEIRNKIDELCEQDKKLLKIGMNL